MKNLILTFSVLFFFFGISFAQNDTWQLYQSMESSNDLLEKDNEIWIATDFGVVRLNKNTLEREVYTMHNSNLPSQHIQSIAEDTDGNVWIGTYDIILAMWDGSDWTNIISAAFPDSLQVDTPFPEWLYKIEVDQNNRVWVGSQDGVSVYDGSDWTYFNAINTDFSDLKNVWDLEFDDEGNLYAAGPNLFKYDGITWTNISLDYPSLLSYGDAGLYKGSEGSIWYTNYFFDCAKLVDGEWINFNNSASGNPPVGVSFIDFGEDDPGLLGFPNTYFTLENGIWEENNSQLLEEIPGNKQFYHVDKDDNHWIFGGAKISKTTANETTYSHLSKFPLFSNNVGELAEHPSGDMFVLNNRFLTQFLSLDEVVEFEVDVPQNGINGIFKSMTFNSNGDLWISRAPGISYFDGTDWEHFDANNAPFVNYLMEEFQTDQNDHLWLASASGLYNYDGSDWQHFHATNSPLNYNNLNKLVIDKNNVVWISASYQNPVTYDQYFELYSIDNGNWTVYNSTNSDLPEMGSVIELHVDQSNKLWVSFYFDGVMTFDGINWEIVDEFSNSDYTVQSISSLDDKIYCGTYGKGVAILEDSTWSYLNENNSGLISDYITKVHADQSERFWMVLHGKGIQVYEEGEVSSLTYDPKLEQATLKINPNPASSSIKLFLENTLRSTQNKIRIIDTNGAIIQKHELGMIDEQDYELEVNISHYPSGVYFVEWSNSNINKVSKIILL